MIDAIPVLQGPPRDEAELLTRARRVAGRTVAEVAHDLGSKPPADLKRAKGYVGELCETALGAPRSNRPEPDFLALGIELKTLPLTPLGRPRESTYVCRVNPADLARGRYHESRFRHKLSRVLFMPYEGDRALPLADRTFAAPVLWSPSDDEDALLRADWEDFALLASEGLLASVSARRGRFLQVRPKAPSARARQKTHDGRGEELVAAPRGFYLRTEFTAAIINKAFG